MRARTLVNNTRPSADLQPILVADPNSANRRLVCNIIQEEGYSVVTAQDGKQACQILHSNNGFSAVVLEGVIPHVSGPELLRYMKSDERLKNIPVLVLTGSKSASFFCECFAVGASVILPEPFTVSQLQNLLHMLVNSEPGKDEVSH